MSVDGDPGDHCLRGCIECAGGFVPHLQKSGIHETKILLQIAGLGVRDVPTVPQSRCQIQE